MPNSPVAIISTYATDILVDATGQVLSQQPGGPILFIEQALEAEHVPYQSASGQTIDVEILMTDTGEFGRVTKQPPVRNIQEVAASDWVIVSTVLQEWSLESDSLPSKLCVDLQGFVRNGDNFGKKHHWDSARTLAKHIYCMKGTQEEVTYIPDDVREDQKKRLLLVTMGAQGADLYHQGEKTHIPAYPVADLPDTIGAGDTFFAHFVAGLYRGLTPVIAAQKASQKTADFLEAKK